MSTALHEMSGQAANRYIVNRPLAVGGMGTVYCAFDVDLQREVALKVPNSPESACVERFAREREIMAVLDHPNFLRVLATGDLQMPQGRRPFFTMPLLRGLTLTELIRRRGRPDAQGGRLRRTHTRAGLLGMVQQLCQALASAHDRGILHRDIKPDNIILGEYGEPYIVDFGVATSFPVSGAYAGASVRPRAEISCLESRSFMESPTGTPYFTAPEQILDPTCSDVRTDVFGLGCVLYYILTGKRPVYRCTQSSIRFPGKDEDYIPSHSEGPGYEDAGGGVLDSPEHLDEILNGDLIPPDETMADERTVMEPVDPEISAICCKAMARRPNRRYSSVRAFGRALQKYAESAPEFPGSRRVGTLSMLSGVSR